MTQVDLNTDDLARDAERYRWLADPERWASVRIDFGTYNPKTESAEYLRHRVCWHEPERGWVDAAGIGLGEAIDAAMAIAKNKGDEEAA